MSKIIPTSKQRRYSIVSALKIKGGILEMLYQENTKRTLFSIWKDGLYKSEAEYVTEDGDKYFPYSASNNLISNCVVLFPTGVEEYISDSALVNEIQTYIHRYVDVSSRFEKISSYYVLLSWVYDNFNELPYLRLRGDYGSGKTRFLLTVGALCYKPIFASGASTMSPIFHILDAFRGTLILDEGDFRFSDEKADMVKILNNGNAKGIPVLRNELSPTKEYNPRAFQVYGPKIVATRGYYDDRALESRFITEEMGGRTLRTDIPINLPSSYKEEALLLRNKLLLYRFRNYGKERNLDEIVDPSIEPRLLQILRPLMSIVDDPALRDELRSLACQYNNDMIVERGMDIEAQVLETIKDINNSSQLKLLTIKNITDEFCKRFGNEQVRAITTKWMGGIVRKRLNLRTQKSHGVYIIPPTEQVKLTYLYQRYGVQ